MAVAKAEKTIEIPELRTAKMLVRIEGERPLLCNQFTRKAMEEMLGQQSGDAKVRRSIRKPDDEFANAAYMINDKTYGFPLIGVQKALITAGGRFTGEHETFLRGALWLLGAELIEIKGPPPTKRLDRVRQAGIGRTMNVRVRAEFFPWSMAVAIEYVENWVTPAQVINLFKNAGTSVGIGDWRVELKNGYFGRFKVAEASEL